MLLCEKLRHANACEAGRAGYNHVVGAAGTVDNLEVARLVAAADDADVGILRVENQVAGQGLLPGDGGAIGVLGVGSAAVADVVCAARGVVEHPIHKAGAVQAVGPVGAGGGAALGCDLGDGAPAWIPAQAQALAAPEVVDLTVEHEGRPHHLPPLRGQVCGEGVQDTESLGVGDGQALGQGGQGRGVGQKLVQC